MNNYDLILSDVKRYVTQCLMRASQESKADLGNLASAIDQLNEAWDKLTDCLVRQRDERSEQIVSLIDQLAEAKKGK